MSSSTWRASARWLGYKGRLTPTTSMRISTLQWETSRYGERRVPGKGLVGVSRHGRRLRAYRDRIHGVPPEPCPAPGAGSVEESV